MTLRSLERIVMMQQPRARSGRRIGWFPISGLAQLRWSTGETEVYAEQIKTKLITRKHPRRPRGRGTLRCTNTFFWVYLIGTLIFCLWKVRSHDQRHVFLSCCKDVVLFCLEVIYLLLTDTSAVSPLCSPLVLIISALYTQIVSRPQ